VYDVDLLPLSAGLDAAAAAAAAWLNVMKFVLFDDKFVHFLL